MPLSSLLPPAAFHPVRLGSLKNLRSLLIYKENVEFPKPVFSGVGIENSLQPRAHRPALICRGIRKGPSLQYFTEYMVLLCSSSVQSCNSAPFKGRARRAVRLLRNAQQPGVLLGWALNIRLVLVRIAPAWRSLTAAFVLYRNLIYWSRPHLDSLKNHFWGPLSEFGILTVSPPGAR